MELLYIGSHEGIEKNLIEKTGVKYAGISSGKLRRYFSWKNFIDPFKVVRGYFEAKRILAEFKPDVVFSKGGFVSTPVVRAAHSLGIPLIIHESDLSPGLANKIAMKYADKICLSFEESRKGLEKYADKIVVTGNPVRESLLGGDAHAALEFTKLDTFRPVILVMGGSQGAMQINKLVREKLDELLKKFQVIHIAGRGNIDIGIHKKGYAQYEYIDEQMKDVYAAAALVISRAGANSLFEIALLKKKAVIIPLETGRGDQVENARIFAGKMGWSVLSGEVSGVDFLQAIELAMGHEINQNAGIENGAKKIVEIIFQYENRR